MAESYCDLRSANADLRPPLVWPRHASSDCLQRFPVDVCRMALTDSLDGTSLATLRSHSVADLWVVCRSMYNGQQRGSRLAAAEEQSFAGRVLPEATKGGCCCWCSALRVLDLVVRRKKLCSVMDRRGVAARGLWAMVRRCAEAVSVARMSLLELLAEHCWPGVVVGVSVAREAMERLQ